MRNAQWLSAAILLLHFSGCSEPTTRQQKPESTELFRCHLLLIGPSGDSCLEDITAPGTLRITFKPDPPQSSWELGVTGLAVLAESCEFHGSFDQTRLSAIQGRGETTLVCPLKNGVDRAYHNLQFTNRTETVNSSMSISVVLSR